MENRKSKLTDERMIDSICTNDDKLDSLLTEIGSRLKAERIRQGFSVAELSELSGVAGTIIYRVENQTNPVGLKSLLRLMWALNVPPEKLIPFNEVIQKKTFGEVVEDITHSLTPRQKQYLIKIIQTDIGFLNAEQDFIKNDFKFSNGLIWR